MTQLHGIHHLTAITANAAGNLQFYTDTLGLRLVKKTVNQDDVSAYHLFYADGKASPGTDITFFDWPAAPERRGAGAVVRTGLRIAGEAAFTYWHDRLATAGLTPTAPETVDGRRQIVFQDHEGQRLALVDDHGAGSSHPWERSPVPADHQIRGLGPITMAVRDFDPSDRFLTEVMAMRHDRRFTDATGTMTQVYAMGEGGAAAELHLRVEPSTPPAKQGRGGVHHVAFRIPDDAYDAWVARLQRLRVPSSGPVDRYYFRSLYLREPGGVLYEIATDGPGFASDEPMESLGERLALPPFLEPRRAEIEAGLKKI